MASGLSSVRLPKVWSVVELTGHVAEARAEFRVRRLRDPLEDHHRLFPEANAAASWVIRHLDGLLGLPADQLLLSQTVGDRNRFAALRCLAAVPISSDDLDTLVDARVSASALRRDKELADRVVRLVRTCIDPMRFPWLEEERLGTPEELRASILSTAVLLTASAVQAGRRGDEREGLEGMVANLLGQAGYQQAHAPRRIRSVADFPPAGQFLRSCHFGGHNGDFIVRLRDMRIMALECKASNSEVNGFKRLNKEVVVDASDWYQQFGRANVVAAAALRGVFKAANVAAAQEAGVYLFWSHRPDDLRDFLTHA